MTAADTGLELYSYYGQPSRLRCGLLGWFYFDDAAKRKCRLGCGAKIVLAVVLFVIASVVLRGFLVNRRHGLLE